jgi:hypothetical protein
VSRNDLSGRGNERSKEIEEFEAVDVGELRDGRLLELVDGFPRGALRPRNYDCFRQSELGGEGGRGPKAR